MIKAIVIVSGLLVSLMAITPGAFSQGNTQLEPSAKSITTDSAEASTPAESFQGKADKVNTQEEASIQGNAPPGSSANQNAPMERIIATPCSEKEVRLRGEFQALFSVMREPSGDTFLRGHFDAEGMTAQGLTSGRKYKADGTSHINSRGPSPNTFNYVFNFALNKEGSFDSLMGHVIFRINVNSNGQATADIVEVKIDC